jgi:hypothetical protein
MGILFNKRIQTDKDVSPPVLSFSSIVQDTIIDYGGSGTLNSTAQAINPSTETVASGTISYQWYRDGVAISGANSATLTLTNQLTAANYYCIASFIRSGTTAPAINSPITSRTARTTIRNNIVFAKQPESRNVILGKSATFSCSTYPNPKSMSGFNPELYGGTGFGDADYNAALSQGFSDADIRYYLEQVWTGRIGPNMVTRLNDSNWGTSGSRNLVYEWYVNGVLTKTTRGNPTSQTPGFNGQGIYLDLTDYIGRVLVEFNVNQDSQPFQRIRIPDLATINGGINARFLKDGYLEERLPNTDIPWGNHKLLLDGGRIYGPISSDTVGAGGYIVSAGEIGTGGYDTLNLSTANEPASNTKQMIVYVDKGFFRTYVNPSDAGTLTLTLGGVTFPVNQPPRVKHFSTLDLTSSVAASSSVYCRVRQENISGDLAPPPINSNTVTFNSTAAECISWDDTRKLGAQVRVSTPSGIKPAPTSVWYGPWVYGTDTDTCYTFFDVQVRDIYPRAINASTDKPFSALFQCRIRGNGGSSGDVINAYKILEWDGNSRVDNENRKQTLTFNSDDFNGQEVIGYGDNGRILFRRTNSNAPGNRISWNPPGSGKIALDILFLEVRRKENGQTIDSFLTVNSTRTDNILEFGRRFDQYEDPY